MTHYTNIKMQISEGQKDKIKKDKTFGLRDKDGKFYIGNKEAKIKESNIIVGNK